MTKVLRFGAGALVGLAALAAVPLQAAPDVRIDKPPAEAAPLQTAPNDAAIWDQIRKGKEGVLANPEGGAGTLMKKPMAGATEKAVGFTTPVHADFPQIGEPQGRGPTVTALALLAALFGGAFGVAAMLARNLGRH